MKSLPATVGLAMAMAHAFGFTANAAALSTASAATHQRLLVIAPAGFRPALTDFLEFKRQLLPTEFRSLEKALQLGRGTDDPEKLKIYLFHEWKTNRLGYVLLVGDVDVLPVRYMVLDRVTPAAFDYAFYPSDLYYADLAKPDGSFDNWNAQTEGYHAGYFGEVRGEKHKEGEINFDGVDYRPEIAVGRWPVSAPGEARLLASKSMKYEAGLLAKTNGRPRAAFFAVGGWVDTRELMGRLAERLTNNWQTESRFYSDARRSSGTPSPDHNQLRAIFNSGIDLAIHTGHGQTDAWEQCLNLRDLDRLTNAERLPVVVSAGCSTAYFAPLAPYDGYVDVNGTKHSGTDHQEVFTAPPPPPAPYQRGRFNPTGLGEQMLKRSASGGVAYIGCNTGSQPCALTLLAGFVTALAESPPPRLGDCWGEAIRHYYAEERLGSLKPRKDWYPPSIFFQGMKFMVFGDPSLRMPANARR